MKITPFTLLTGAVSIGLFVVALVIFIALSQPWLGIRFMVDQQQVVAFPTTPSAQTISPGMTVSSLSSAGKQESITPFDLSVEPDGAMGSYQNYRDFLQRQGRIHQLLSSDKLTLFDDQAHPYELTVHASRPLSSLSVEFWVQVSVGFIAWLISAAVFAYRSSDTSARFLLLSGASTLCFAPLAAVYSTRELALPATTFQWLNDGNFLGGSLFTASFVALLLNYPRRLGPRWLGSAVVLVFVCWFIAQQLGAFDSMTFARRFLVIVGVSSTFFLAAVHWFTTRRDPAARASLQWFLLSWMLGTCLFGFFILLPQMFGVDTSSLQGYAFTLFLLVYLGLAFGILRYRLFDLGRWWAHILLWLVTLMVLVLSDLLFLFLLNLSSTLSLTLALVLTGMLWLPLRSLIWNRVFGSPNISQQDLFAQVVDVALAPEGSEQNQRWKALLQQTFRPLQIESALYSSEPDIRENGLKLILPSVALIKSLELSFADGGRKLFNTNDAMLAAELVSMLQHSLSSRTAYEQGVSEERQRIARDIHDNIGAHLLSALQQQEAARKDEAIRETLTDLRDIINNASAPGLSISEAFGDLRAETSARLEVAQIALDWNIADEGDHGLTPVLLPAVRSIVREAVSNSIKHSTATSMRIHFEVSQEFISIELEDNGKGFDTGQTFERHGLSNLKQRVAEVRGELQISSNEHGTRLSTRIPLTKEKPL